MLKAKFAKLDKTEFELCVNKSLSEKWKLLEKMHLIQDIRRYKFAIVKVARLIEAQFADSNYSIIRVSDLEFSSFLADNLFYITLIQIAEDRKSTVKDLQLSIGITTFVHKKRKIIIESNLDILFVLTSESISSFEEIKI